MDDNAPAGMGHNMPPITLDDIYPLVEGFPLADVAARLPDYDRAVSKQLVDRMKDIAAAAAAWLDLGKIEDEQTAALAADQISQMVELKKQIEAAQKAGKAIWAAKGKKAGEAYERILGGASIGIEKMRSMQTAYLTRVREEKEREAERQRAEAEALAAEAAAQKARAEQSNDLLGMADAQKAEAEAQAAQKLAQRSTAAANKVSVKSATGAGRGVSLVRTKRARITNHMAAMLHYKAHPDMIELVQRLAAAEVRAASFSVEKDAIPGVEAYYEEAAR